MKKVALFGGSFNPSHDGHFQAMRHLHRALGVDEVWMMFSINWQKDANKYASLKDRMEMGSIMKADYPDIPVVLSDIEEILGTHITYGVLNKLHSLYPDHQFIWVMGADNLASFHTWEHADDIIEQFPIAVIDRPPYGDRALSSHTALTYAHLYHDTPQNMIEARQGWCMVKGLKLEMSSSHLLDEMRQGTTKFSGGFQKVADYIRKNNLYGVSDEIAKPMITTPAP